MRCCRNIDTESAQLQPGSISFHLSVWEKSSKQINAIIHDVYAVYEARRIRFKGLIYHSLPLGGAQEACRIFGSHINLRVQYSSLWCWVSLNKKDKKHNYYMTGKVGEERRWRKDWRRWREQEGIEWRREERDDNWRRLRGQLPHPGRGKSKGGLQRQVGQEEPGEGRSGATPTASPPASAWCTHTHTLVFPSFRLLKTEYTAIPKQTPNPN